MASMRQYIAWAEKCIARLVVAEGLRCGLLSVVQGPLTLTFRVRLLSPSPTALRKLLSMGPALGAALQCGSVRISQGPDAVYIEIPSPQPRTPTAQELARHTHGLSVCVGYDALRKPVHVDLRQHGALMWVGPSRRGKTQSMKCALYALARQVQSTRLRYVILSQKRQDWQAFAPAVGCMGVVSDPDEVQHVLAWTVAVLQKAAQHGLDHTFIVVCDDLLNLLSRASGIAEPLAEIASMGAGLGVHLLVGTQVAGSKAGTGGSGVEANVTARIVYKSSSATAAARDAGQGGAGLDMLTTYRGDALLIVDGEPQRIATGYADDRDIVRLEAGDLVVAPWRFFTGSRSGSQEPTRNRPELSQEPASTREEPPRTGSYAPPTDNAHGGNVEGGREERFPVPTFPIEEREPTPAEASAIRQLHADGESLSALCRMVYGHKNGKTFGWIKDAVADTHSGCVDGAPDDRIDLNTESGRREFRTLLSENGIDWQATREQYKDRRFLN